MKQSADAGMERAFPSTKACRVCQVIQPLSNFHRKAKGADGRCNMCKACAAMRAKARYAADPDLAKGKSHAYYVANATKAAASMAEYRTANPELLTAQRRAGYVKNQPAKVAYQQAHRAKVRQDPELLARRRFTKRKHTYRRRAIAAGFVPVATLTFAEWVGLLAVHHGRCHYCLVAAAVSMDHRLPVTRGGQHTKANVTPACMSCNSRKHTSTVEEWLEALALGAAA